MEIMEARGRNNMPEKIISKCVVCKKEFVHLYPCRKTCSQKCYRIMYFGEEPKNKCRTCGKQTINSHRVYCSAECKIKANTKKKDDYYYELLKLNEVYQLSTIKNSTQKYKLYAYRTIQKYMKEGKIKRMPCIVCGNIKGEAHHTDYTKPLIVYWLCRTHHVIVHKGGI
jgi:hypothetical protein